MKIESRRIVFALLAMVGLLIWTPNVGATVILSDGNSTVRINETSQAGVSDWVVDGVDMLFQQWFWYRIGSSGGEFSINTIDTTPVVELGFGTSAARITYSNANLDLEVEVTYVLAGGSPGSTRSDLDEQIVFTNTGSESRNFHFFQYSDFDLCGNGGDTATVLNGSRVQQVDGVCSLSETVLTPAADLWEARGFPVLLNNLNNSSPTTLNPAFSSFGPGDATWAYQWDFTLAAGESYLISKDKSIQPIPEPATLTLLGVGAGLLGLTRKRRKA